MRTHFKAHSWFVRRAPSTRPSVSWMPMGFRPGCWFGRPAFWPPMPPRAEDPAQPIRLTAGWESRMPPRCRRAAKPFPGRTSNARLAPGNCARHGSDQPCQRRRVSRAALRREQPGPSRTASAAPLTGIRTTFTPPAVLRRQAGLAHFYGINYIAEVWVNGHQAAPSRARSRAAYSTSPPTSRSAGPNALAVHVLRSLTRARRTKRPSPAGPGPTAASPPWTARLFFAPSGGTGFPPFATATPAFGRM